MAIRSSWKGYLKISLVSIPVRAYTGSSGTRNPITLNQLHNDCHSRIRYKKTCPIHGDVPSEEIVSGYEFAKDQYVVINPDDLEELRPENDHSLNVDSFIPAEAVDAAYLTGKTYYLLPDGPVGQKAYQLIQQAMVEDKHHAIAHVVLFNREQLVRLRPVAGLLAMDILEFQAQVKDPAAFQDELSPSTLTAPEKKLTRQLIDALAKESFDPSQYKDLYTERLTLLIEARVQGEKLVRPPAVAEPEVINLMDALRQSVEKSKQQAPRPPRRRAPSVPKPAATAKKTTRKKSG